jgi:hypothetical protein
MGVDPTQQRRDQRMTGDRGTGDRMGSSARARALASLDRTRQRMAQPEAADSTAPSIPYTVELGAQTVLPEQPGQARGVTMPNRYVPPPLSPDFQRTAREQQESERSRRHPRRGSATPREPRVIQLEPIEIYGRVPQSTTEASSEALPDTSSASVERGTADRGTETTPRSPLRVDLSPEGRERARQSMDSFLQDQPQLLPNDPSTLPLRLRRSQLPPRPGYLLDRWFAGDDAALEPLRPQLDQLESRLDRSRLPGNLAGIGLGVLRFIREISASLVSLMRLISELPWDTLHVINRADLEEFAITLRDLLSAEIEDQAVTRALAEAVWAPILRIVEHFREAIRLAEEGHQVQSSAEITQATLEIIDLIGAVEGVLQAVRRLPDIARNLGRLRTLRRRFSVSVERTRRRIRDSAFGRAIRELDDQGSFDPDALIRNLRPERGTAREAGHALYEQLARSRRGSIRSRRAIFPDRTLYPTVEIRPNGDILGSHDHLTTYLNDAGLTGRRRTGLTTVESHHLLEDRLIEQFGIHRDEGLCIALEASDHAVFSAELPRYLPRGGLFYDIDEIFTAHTTMYQRSGHSEWIPEIRRFLRQHRDGIRRLYQQRRVPGADEPDFSRRLRRVMRFLDEL